MQPVWPGTCDPPASPSWVPRLQVCITVANWFLKCLIYCHWSQRRGPDFYLGLLRALEYVLYLQEARWHTNWVTLEGSGARTVISQNPCGTFGRWWHMEWVGMDFIWTQNEYLNWHLNYIHKILHTVRGLQGVLKSVQRWAPVLYPVSFSGLPLILIHIFFLIQQIPGLRPPLTHCDMWPRHSRENFLDCL
jgi:hypothetical protein